LPVFGSSLPITPELLPVNQMLPSLSSARPCHYDVDLQPNQFGRQRREAIRLPIRVSPLHGQILAIDVTEFVQSAVEWIENSCRMRGGTGHQQAHARRLAWLLDRLRAQ
jgi:hypothetical protein